MQFTSDIINQDNYNIFKNLLETNLHCHINNLNRVYSSEINGMTREIMQQHLVNKSNLIILAKTVENKVFGIYESQVLHYDNMVKIDNDLSLFSVDLNEWFRSQECRLGAFRLNFSDFANAGFQITFATLVLLGVNNKCYYNSLDTNSLFDMRGLEVFEIFGGLPSQDVEDCNEVNTIAIEAYQLNN